MQALSFFTSQYCKQITCTTNLSLWCSLVAFNSGLKLKRKPGKFLEFYAENLKAKIFATDIQNAKQDAHSHDGYVCKTLIELEKQNYSLMFGNEKIC